MEFIFDQNARNEAHPDFSSVHSSLTPDSRRQVSSVNEIEIIETPKKRRRRAPAKSAVKYVSTSRKKKVKKWTWSWAKLGWIVCGILTLRLVFMENGIVDYYKMEESIQDKQETTKLVQAENTSIRSEIKKIKNSPRYQKKLARDHLGVIAPGEFLVIFSQGKPGQSN